MAISGSQLSNEVPLENWHFCCKSQFNWNINFSSLPKPLLVLQCEPFWGTSTEERFNIIVRPNWPRGFQGENLPFRREIIEQFMNVSMNVSACFCTKVEKLFYRFIDALSPVIANFEAGVIDLSWAERSSSMLFCHYLVTNFGMDLIASSTCTFPPLQNASK